MRLKLKPKLQAEWVAVTVGVLAAGAIYAGFIHPSVATVAAMGDARARQEAASNDLQEARRQHQALLSTIVEQKEQLATLGGSPPSLSDKEAQVARIAVIARDCQVAIDQYQPIGDLDTSEYSAAYVQITARGPFPRICDFFRRVEAELEYVDVTHFALTASTSREKPAEPGCLVSWSCKLSGMPRQSSGAERPATPKGDVTAEVGRCMTKRRWTMLIVVLVAGGAFVVDRLFLGEPEAAQAKPAPKPTKSKPTAATTKKPTAAPVVNDPSLAWLERLADPRPGRDVFTPSPAWLQSQKDAAAKTKAKSEQQQGPQPGSPEAFQAAHRLQATTVMEGGGIAVVDGQCLSVGDVIEDFQLVRVEAGEAEFRRGRQSAVLRLPMGPASRAKTSPSAPSCKKAAPPAAQPPASGKSSMGTSFWRRLLGAG